MAIDSKVLNATIALNNRYKAKKKGYTNSDGYQCVALMQKFFNLANVGFKDGYYPTAWEYAQAFKKGLPAGKTVMGLNPNEWKIVYGPYQAGDVLFYAPTASNPAGHVAIATSDNYRLEQNTKAGYNSGAYPYIIKSKIGNPSFGLRKVVKGSKPKPKTVKYPSVTGEKVMKKTHNYKVIADKGLTVRKTPSTAGKSYVVKPDGSLFSSKSYLDKNGYRWLSYVTKNKDKYWIAESTLKNKKKKFVKDITK